MKLWIVVQWGNSKEGPNGEDTQCIVRSNDMMSAIDCGENNMCSLGWKNGQADMVVLLGDDGTIDDGKTKLIIREWINSAIYYGDYSSWHINHLKNEWVDAKTMFGDQ